MVKYPVKTFQINDVPSETVTMFLAGPKFAIAAAPFHATLFDESWSVDSFAKLLCDEAVVALGVEVTDHKKQQIKTIGFIILRCAAHEAEIITLGIDKNYQGQSIAKTLCQCAFEWVQTMKNVETIFLEVAENNVSARRLYEKLCFEVVGRRKSYYTVRQADHQNAAQKQDALVMRLDMTKNEANI